MIDLAIFILKYAFLAFLYLFLFWLLRLIAKDLRPGEKPAARSAVHRAKLVLEKSPGQTRTRLIPIKDEITIGRGSENTVALDDESVSTFHARIFVEGDRFMLEDLGSTNGTFVSGQIVVGQTPLQTGNSINIGRSQFIFTQV